MSSEKLKLVNIIKAIPFGINKIEAVEKKSLKSNSTKNEDIRKTDFEYL